MLDVRDTVIAEGAERETKKLGFRHDITIVKLSGLTCRKEDRHKETEII